MKPMAFNKMRQNTLLWCILNICRRLPQLSIPSHAAHTIRRFSETWGGRNTNKVQINTRHASKEEREKDQHDREERTQAASPR